MIRYNIAELVDIPRVQRLTDLFFKATGIVTALVTLDGTVLTRSGWQDICLRFHRINPETSQRCVESDTHIANKIGSGQKYYLYQCKNGLIDAAVPIVVEGYHVANFFTGQFLFQSPDLDFFRKQAKEFGFDETEYLACAEKIPVMDEGRLQPFLEYFAEFAELLSDMGIRQLRQRAVEEQLRASETRMNRTQEIALLGSWELEVAGNKLYWSDQTYSILGLSPQEAGASYEVFLDRVHPDDRAAVDEAYMGSLREGRDTYEIEHRVVRKSDGAIRIVHEKCEHIKDAANSTVRSVGMIHDITERKKVEEKLKESEERYRSLFENMLEGYAYCQMIFDNGVPADFIYLDVNNAFEVLTGLRNVVGRKVSEVIPGIRETDPELLRIYGRVASTGMPERFERYVEALRMWFSVSVYSPRKECFVAVFDVITERKQAEEALRRTQEKLEMRVKERTAELESAHIKLKAEVEERKRLATAVEHAAEGVIIVDPSWHIQYVNPAFTSMTGYSQEESITKDIRFLQPDNADHSAYEAARRRVNPDMWFISRLAQRRKDGSSFPVEASTSSLLDNDGKLIGYVLLWRDISERVELEERLRQSQKMEAIGTLAGGIAHDFNNILAAILGFTEMAIDDSAGCLPAAKSLHNIHRSALRARDLVKQILAFSRKTNYERAPLSLSPVVNETVQLLRASIPANVEIKLSVTTVSDTILASPTEVQQILMNLATNAALAMQDKGGVLEIDLTDIDFMPDSPVSESDVPDEHVQLKVKDTGTGMSPDVMKRAFEPFFTTRAPGEGTGMGLAVVYGIVTDLGGTITIESEPGTGSTFRVFLPKANAAVREDRIPAHKVPTGSGSILFVDDEDMLVEWARVTLERLGYSVLALTDPGEALKIFVLDPSHFDLVITDQSMPAMSGMQFAKELLSMRPGIPIILCTGHSATASPEAAREVGIKQFLMKPVTKQELAKAVRKVLEEPRRKRRQP